MPKVVRMLLLAISLMAMNGLWPGDALAQETQLNRCAGPGGDTIYTDRPCDTIGARERLPRSTIAGTYGLRRGGCARNLQDLVYEITAAIDNHDVNRLGAVYHWVGQSAESGEHILDQLQTIVDRPLVDIVALRGAAAAPTGDAGHPSSPMDAATGPGLGPTPPSGTSAVATAAAPAPQPAVRRTAVGLRLKQTLGKQGIPAQTVFGLRRHLDCWWIAL